MYNSLSALVAMAAEGPISRVARRDQARQSKTGALANDQTLMEALNVMRHAVERGLNPALRSQSGLTGGGAAKMMSALGDKRLAMEGTTAKAQAYALAAAESNAAMGRIVAAPTAGASGILPGVLLSLQEDEELSDQTLVDALYTAGAIGIVIAQRASISGAEGGCQAECGTAAAMAAAALVELKGGSAQQAADAVGFALMNVMGLVCDPVQGLVEVPCVFRNVAGVMNAFVAANLALSGIACPVEPDEVIDAMKAVGDSLCSSLRETGEGGIAVCPSAGGRCGR